MTKKEQLIQEYLTEPIKVGDEVELLGVGSQDPKSWSSPFTVKKLENGSLDRRLLL